MIEPTAEPPGPGNADSAWLSMTEPTAEPPGLGNADSALAVSGGPSGSRRRRVTWMSVGR